jgi:hypothetical protein
MMDGGDEGQEAVRTLSPSTSRSAKAVPYSVKILRECCHTRRRFHRSTYSGLLGKIDSADLKMALHDTMTVFSAQHRFFTMK